MFYGVNGHYDYLQSVDEQIAMLQMLGMAYYRCTYEGNPESLDYLERLAQALQATDIDLICCVNLNMTGDDGQLHASEAQAHNVGWQMGYECAQALVPYGVRIFECGNELDSKNNIRQPVQDVQGGVPEDFDNAQFPALRGLLNGCAAGVRTVGGVSTLIASNAFTACSIACADMLWRGQQPDGSTGHTPVRWDLTNWHNYRCYGSPMSMSMDYEKPSINLLDHLKSSFGKPIIFTEWNANEGDDDATRSDWAKQFLGEMLTGRDMFGVQAACCYQLIAGSPWGLCNGDGSLIQTFGQTVHDFIQANPA